MRRKPNPLFISVLLFEIVIVIAAVFLEYLRRLGTTEISLFGKFFDIGDALFVVLLGGGGILILIAKIIHVQRERNSR
ncbi:hypothetical protein [Mucilaginibacter sp.]|uniref:hypothetical protein n=1 Tax=Mucilaginibacter sp. TaxID=1882438 RepID=UPI00284DA474|nr:hypothetical protein [Mucilaginibacter sp.]MDR3694222.1 hypothetical protein [Mucilaginibacter sp.]